MAKYTVKPGDTLSGIGKQFGVDYMDIARDNGIANPDLIYDGQVLTINESTNADNSATQDTAAQPENEAPTFQYKPYTPSDTVTQAEALLQEQMSKKPGDYQSTWQSQIDDILQKILNREDFSYDVNGDALYQQYKDQYMTQGKMAMMDTMGQAQAMTGGYGNSYAQTVGQQAYQGYLQGLNDRIPELYQLALNQYNAEGDEMYRQAAMMAQQEEQDYSRYRDDLADYYAELDRRAEEARYQAEQDYAKWADDRDFSYGQYSDDRAYAYQQDRDKVADAQWQAQFDEAKRQFDLQYSQSRSSGGSGGSSGGSSQKSNGSGNSSGSNGSGGSGNGGGNFTGSTYSEACAYLKAKGKSSAGLMTQSEWVRHKNNNSSAGGEHEASSYKEYLAAYIYGQLN